MIFRLIPLAMLQSLLLAAGQVLLKFGLGKMEPFAWSTAFWKSVFLNWQCAGYVSRQAVSSGCI